MSLSMYTNARIGASFSILEVIMMFLQKFLMISMVGQPNKALSLEFSLKVL